MSKTKIIFLIFFGIHSFLYAESWEKQTVEQKRQTVADALLRFYRENLTLPSHRYQLAEFLELSRTEIEGLIPKEEFLPLIQQATKYEKFRDYIASQLTKIFSETWQLPSTKIAVEKLGIPTPIYKLMFEELSGEEFIKKYDAEKMTEAKDRLERKYIELAKDRKEYPEGEAACQLLAELLTKSYSNMTVEAKSIKVLIDILYENGMNDLKETARDSGKLKFVIDRQFINEKATEDVIKAIREHDNILISAIPDGYPLTTGTIQAWDAWRKENNGIVILIPLEYTNGNFDPTIFEHDWIHLLFDEIELGENLAIAGLPVTRKMLNPLANTQLLGNRSQSLIIGAPRLMAETIPTSDNKHQSKIVMTTGAAESAIYLSEFYLQLRTARLAQELHQRGAIIAQKVSKTGAFNQGDLSPHGDWHLRHVEMTEGYVDHRGRNIPAGFNDLNRRYTETGKVMEIKPYAAVLGDIHFPDMTNLRALKQVIATIKEHGGVDQIYLHDVIEGSPFNHHLADRPGAKSKLTAKQRDLGFIIREYVRLVNWLLTQLPTTNVVIVESNHPEWFNRYIDSQAFVNDPQNYQLAYEINGFAVKHHLTPLHALILITQDRSFRQRFSMDEVSDFDRLILSKAGDGMKTPTAIPVTTSHHGHQGANGGPGTKTVKQMGDERAITGHTHTFRRAHNVIETGTLTVLDPDYTTGGYSSWVGPVFSYIYPDGAMTSLIGHRQSNEFFRPKDASPAGESFFAPSYPRAVPILIGGEQGAALDSASLFSRGNRGVLRQDDPRRRNNGTGRCDGSFM